MLESAILAKTRSKSWRWASVVEEYVTRSSTQKEAHRSRPVKVTSMALVKTLEALRLPWIDRLNFMMQLPDLRDTKKVTPLDCSVRPIWKNPLEKSKVLLTGFPAKCMKRLSMWPRVATSGFVTELVGRRSRHKRYCEEMGVGIVLFSSMVSKRGCSMAFSAGGACFLIRTMLVAQSVTVLETILCFSRLSMRSSAASRRGAGQNRCLGHGGRSAVKTMLCLMYLCKPRSKACSDQMGRCLRMRALTLA